MIIEFDKKCHILYRRYNYSHDTFWSVMWLTVREGFSKRSVFEDFWFSINHSSRISPVWGMIHRSIDNRLHHDNRI